MRFTPRPDQRRSDPPPIQENASRIIVIGMAAWAVALLVLVVQWSNLQSQGRGWWIWTPVVAIGLGLYGLRAARRRS